MKIKCDFCDKDVLKKQEIYKSELSSILMPNNPIYFGHFIIIPNAHRKRFLDLQDSELVSMKDTLGVLYSIMREKYSAKGYNVFTNNGKIAGQSVMHNHWHVFIRFPDEKISPFDILNGNVKTEPMSKSEWHEKVKILRNLFK